MRRASSYFPGLLALAALAALMAVTLGSAPRDDDETLSMTTWYTTDENTLWQAKYRVDLAGIEAEPAEREILVLGERIMPCRLADSLEAAARSGAKVRLVVASRGLDDSKATLTRLQRLGAEVYVDGAHPVRGTMLLIGTRRAFIGSYAIDDETCRTTSSNCLQVESWTVNKYSRKEWSAHREHATVFRPEV